MNVGKIEQLTQNNPIVEIGEYVSKYERLVNGVNNWAKEKGILDKATPLTQHSKTQEEVLELQVALEEENLEEIIDALGDILVTLIIQAKMNDLNLIDCLESAYSVISKRTGKMEDGLFVKDE